MKTSAKYLTAALIIFAVIVSSVLIVREIDKDAAVTLSSVYTIVLCSILAVICFIIARRHKKTRRYFIFLALVMVCYGFADLYYGLHTLLRGVEVTAASSLNISTIAYLGAAAFYAALCARIWYEEIPKSARNRKKIIAISIAAVLPAVIVGAVSFSAGSPTLSTVLTLILETAILCYSVRFFFVPKAAAKPFLPLMIVITCYALYEMIWSFIIPLIPGISSSGVLSLLFAEPMTLLTLLSIPALILAGERMREKTEGENTAENSTALPDAGGMK